MYRKFISLILIITIMLPLSSCEQSEQSNPVEINEVSFDTSTESIAKPPEEKTEITAEVITPLLTKLDGIRNPLSGEECTEEVANLRPFAISVANTKKAVPQWGISGAEILMEWMVTISVTRFCALFQGFDEDQTGIGPERSIRVNLAHQLSGLDVIAMSASGPDNALNAVKELDMDYINLLSKGYSACYRDDALRSAKGLEYSLIVLPDKMEKRAQQLIERRNHYEGYKSFLNFTANAKPENGTAANSVLINFQKCKKSIFEYDQQNDLYRMSEYDQKLIDAKTNKQVSFTNLIILMVETWDLGDGSSHVGVKIPGNGEGYYCNGGQMVPINWEKASDSSQYKFTLKDGSPLQVGVGHSYMAFAPLNSIITFE